jgi:MFS family permease
MALEGVSEHQSSPDDLLLDGLVSESKDKSRVHIMTTTWKLYAIVFIVNLSFQILIPAQTQIYENIYCAQWYRRHPVHDLPSNGTIPESYCKLGPVQTQVSSLKGWLEVFMAVPSLLLSIPIGMLADSIGRRLIFTANALSLALMQVWITFVTCFGGGIPLRAVWLAGGFGLFTGGTIVTEMLFMCMLTDISPEGQVANAFFRATSFAYAGRVLGPLIAGALMRRDPWYAVYLGLACLAFTFAVVVTIPETFQSTAACSQGATTTLEQADEGGPTTKQKQKFTFAASRSSMRQVLKIWSDWRLVSEALTLPFKIVYFALNDLVQRYVSDRYGWTLANATLLYAVQAATTTLMLLTFLPLVSNHIDKRFSLSVLQKNVVMTRASLFVLAVAYTVIGLAPNTAIMVIGMVIETLSTGLPSTMRALAAALVSTEDKGRVFSVLAVAETLSTMIAYPVTAALFNIGLEKGGGAWLGLPYDFVAVAAAGACLVMCLLRFERPPRI